MSEFKTQDAKISVIMPVYGGEKLLAQCIDSVLNQSYKNLEIIIVNDGSPDNSHLIIDTYADKDPRIVSIRKENAGYGAAINSGLAIATGDYISIIETDDWVESDMMQVLIGAAYDTGSPVVKAGFNRIKNETFSNTQLFDHFLDFSSGLAQTIKPMDHLELFLLESSVWTALYKKDFLDNHNITMLETPGASYQDMPFKFMVYALAESITIINKPVYNYRVMNEGSSSVSSEKALISFKNYEAIRRFLENENIFIKYKNIYYLHQLFDLVFHASRLKGDGYRAFKKQANSIFKVAEKEGFSADNFTFSPDTNDYYYNHVLPVFKEIMQPEKIVSVNLKRRYKARVINLLRTVANKLIVKPIVDFSLHRGDVTSGQIDDLTKKIDLLENRLINHFDNIIESNLTVIDMHIAPTHQYAYFMKAFHKEINVKRKKFEIGLDDFSLSNVDKLFKLYEVLPHFQHDGTVYKIPLNMTLFTDEDRFVILNKDKLIEKEKEAYVDFDVSDLPFCLATNYFKSGLKYVPERKTEFFAGKIAIDAGAWLGDTSIMFARYGFDKVYAFEPLLDNFNLLKGNLERNKHLLNDVIVPVNFAVNEQDSTVNMVKVGDDGVGSCITSDTHNSVSVASCSLDSYFKGNDKEVGLIKFDVEGYELPALKGAEELIRTHKPVLLVSVYHLWLDPKQIFSCKEYIENLDLGYQFKFVHLQPEKDLIYEYMLVCW